MKESLILKISLVLLILTIPLLFFFSITIEPQKIPIEKINKQFLDQKIKTSGTITKIINLNNLQIINLTSNEKSIILINYNPKNLSKNEKLIVVGKLQEYNKSLEIIIEKLYITTLKLS